MKNYLDGGEAILEAFRKLRIDYIMSSPGSEWSPVWEALARQKIENKVGPTFVESWHETLAVNPDLAIEQQWYGGLTVGGIERFVEPVAKWARAVTSPYTLYETVIRAGEMAQRLPKGPIYLNVALEHMLHDWTPPASAREVPPAPRTQPRQQDLEKVAELVRNAKSPVIVTENSGRNLKAFSALRELADLLAIPV